VYEAVYFELRSCYKEKGSGHVAALEEDVLLKQETGMSGFSGKSYFVAILLVAFCAMPVKGVIILGQFDWDPPDSSDGVWTADHTGWVNLSYPASGGNTAGWMRIEFPATASAPPNEWSEVMHTPATNLFAGMWTTQMSFQMDFWGSNYVAGAVQFRWKSTTNSSVWRYDVTPSPLTQTWATVTAPLTNWSEWKYPVGSSEARYLSDLQSIEWVGVYIYRNTADEQIYGIDNFSLTIPEPAELVMLAAAIATSGMSFRRKRRQKKKRTSR